jgi:hypothetical protein
MTVLKSLALAAFLLPFSALAQPLSEKEKGQVHDMCLGFSMISKGIMQARQQGESQESVKAQLDDVISKKGADASEFLTQSTQVLLKEAYTVPVASDPKKAQDLALAFGVATYTQCMERIPALIEKSRSQSPSRIQK